MVQFSKEEIANWRSQIVTSNPAAKTFIRLRQILAANEDLARVVAKHNKQIAILFENVQKMLAPPPVKKNPIGFVPAKD